MTPEGKIKKEIMEYLTKLPGCFVRNVQIGGIRGRANTGKGMSDIIGVFRGRFLAIEVKTERGILAPHQREFLNDIERHGGVAFVARSLDDVIKALEPHIRAYAPSKSNGIELPVP